MRDWDWPAFGLRLATTAEGAAELEAAKAAITALTSSHTKAELFAEAQRRRLLLAPVTTPAELVTMEHLRERGYWEDVDGRTCPGAVRAVDGVAAADARPAARDRRPTRAAPRARRHARRDADAGRRPPPARRAQGRRPHVGVRRAAGDAGARRLRGHRRQGRGSRPPRRVARRRRRAARATSALEGSVAFAHFNCGKQSLSLDLDERDGARRAARPRALGRRARRVVHARRDGRRGASGTRRCWRSTRASSCSAPA